MWLSTELLPWTYLDPKWTEQFLTFTHTGLILFYVQLLPTLKIYPVFLYPPKVGMSSLYLKYFCCITPRFDGGKKYSKLCILLTQHRRGKYFIHLESYPDLRKILGMYMSLPLSVIAAAVSSQLIPPDKLHVLAVASVKSSEGIWIWLESGKVALQYHATRDSGERIRKGHEGIIPFRSSQERNGIFLPSWYLHFAGRNEHSTLLSTEERRN